MQNSVLNKCEFSDKSRSIKVAARAASDFKSWDLRKKKRLYPFYLFESLSLTFAFSSQPSSAFAYIVINKILFLEELRKRPRLIVKPRKCVKLIFYDQDWERIPPDSGCPSRPASWKRQSRWRLNFCDWSFITASIEVHRVEGRKNYDF